MYLSFSREVKNVFTAANQCKDILSTQFCSWELGMEIHSEDQPHVILVSGEDTTVFPSAILKNSSKEDTRK